jgi:uncharacterized membrane protein
MMGWHGGWGLFWVALAAVGIWGAMRAISSGNGRSASSQADAEPDAEAALRRRFAEGEITREEFEERLKVLRDAR